MFSEADQLSFTVKGEWLPLPRISRTVPFGYVEDEDDPDLLQPVVLELEALEIAKVHLKQFSYRDVARWLSKTTGRQISHMGLKKRVDNERRRRRKAAVLKDWANRADSARAKANKALEKLDRRKEEAEQLSFDF